MNEGMELNPSVWKSSLPKQELITRLEQVSYFWSYFRNEKMAKHKVFFGRALYTFIRSLL